MLDDLEMFKLLDDGVDPILRNNLQALELCNQQLAKLIPIKEKLVDKIIDAIGHKRSGSKTYYIGRYAVTATIPERIVLDIEKYEAMVHILPKMQNFVSKQIKYHVSSEGFKEFHKNESSDDRLLLSECMTVIEGKKSIKLAPNLKA